MVKLLANSAIFLTALGLIGGIVTMSGTFSGAVPGPQSTQSAEPRRKDANMRMTLQRSELLVVLPTSLARQDLVYASRWWRRGVPTFIVTDATPSQDIVQDAELLHKEHWGQTYKDIFTPHTKLGDLRAAIAPFLANKTLGLDNYKWILYGDDDTVFFIENVLKVLNALNHSDPYLLSDALWWPEGGDTRQPKLHPNRDAPRCLPCNFNDPLYHGGSCPGRIGFIASEGCHCTPEIVYNGTWTSGDQPVFDRSSLDFSKGAHVPRAGWWYFLHGGAGAIISSGAMRLGNFEDVQRFLIELPWHSGDAMLTEVMWHVMKLAPTDPGYGYCRPHIQMFDPGWHGRTSRGPEDKDVADLGADPLGVIDRLEAAIQGNKGCNANCHEQLQHMLTAHVRARYAGGASQAKDNHPIVNPWGTGCDLIEKLAKLFDQYSNLSSSNYRAAMRRRSGPGHTHLRMRVVRPLDTNSPATLQKLGAVGD